MSKRFKVEHNDWFDNPTLYITLHHPPYEDEDVLARIKWKAKDGNILTGVSGVKRTIASGAIIFNKDDLQRTKGIGPFIEEKLNALGIYTFEQISKMDSELEDQVNIAIEFFKGRVKRDKWVDQSKEFLKE